MLMEQQRKATLTRLVGAILCPKCRRPVAVRFNGVTSEPFLGCSGYPMCKWTTVMPSAVLMEEEACLAVY